MRVRIHGQSEKKAVARRLDIELLDSEVRLSIGQLDGDQDEEAITLQTKDVEAALGTPPGPVHQLNGQSSTGNPKLADVRRRDESVYVWIRTEGSEGWEIVVPRFELVEA